MEHYHMLKSKKIAWESWNSKVQEAFFDEPISEEDEDIDIEEGADTPIISPEMFLSSMNRAIHTPLGFYANDSLMQPSERWDCWIGHTNFDITIGIAEQIEKIDGVEVLKILGRYSFFIGIGKMFDIKDVRTDIEKLLCTYTEEEILSDIELQETVDLVKQQLQSVDYWSILVSPNGEVEYIASDKMDTTYLDGLNKLTLLRNKNGGIILRGTNG